MRFKNVSGDGLLTKWGEIPADDLTPDLESVEAAGLIEQTEKWQAEKADKPAKNTTPEQEN